MIKCKEDLYGTHVLLRDKEAAEIYVGLINKFGISGIVLGGHSSEDAIEVHKADWCYSGWDASFTKVNENGLDVGSRRLTLSDLKPRTRTEYERVTESASHVIDEFENGGKFYYTAPSLTKPALANRDGVFNKLRDGDELYRRVEKEIDERQEFIERARAMISKSHTADYSLGKMYDAGCRFQD